MTLKEPTWLYKGQLGRIFPEGADVPEGWNFQPEVPYAADGEWPEIVTELHTPKADKTEEVKRGPGRPPKPAETEVQAQE